MDHRRPVILLVEDEGDLLQVLAEALGRALPRYEVAALGTADEALDLLADLEASGTPLAVALADHRLAGSADGDGLEILEDVSRRFPKAMTFLFTGQATAPVEARAKALGTRVLWKPLRLKTLLGEVEAALA